MKKTFKIALISICSFTVIVVIAAVLLAMNINKDTVKDSAIKFVQAKTGRKFEIKGDMNLSFFPLPGLKVNGVSLGSPQEFGDTPFVSLDELGIRFKLSRLIFGSAEISSLVLKGLNLNLVKNRRGLGNWQNLLVQSNSDHNKLDNAIFAPIVFTVGSAEVKDAALLWRDEQADSKLRLDNLNLSCNNINLSSPHLNIKQVSFDLYDGKVSGQASLDLNNKAAISLKLALDGADLHALLMDLAGFDKLKGVLKVDTDISMSGANLDVALKNMHGNGSVLVTNGAYYDVDVPFEVRRTHALLTNKAVPKRREGLPRTDFSNLSFHYQIDNGVLSTRDFFIQDIDYKVTGYGSANLFTKHINFSLNAYSLNDSSFFVPIRVSGSLANPTVVPDVVVVLGQAVKGVIEKVIKNPVVKQVEKLKLPADLKKILPL